MRRLSQRRADGAGAHAGIEYPRIPGHEVIGVVDAIGPGVKGWSVGARAGVGWFGGSCGYCGHCRRDSAFACENVHAVTGVTRDGGYATHMIAHESSVAHVPDDLDAVESAPLLCAGVTTFNALRHSGAGAGDLVAVHGVGGLGHLGIQFAARQGFRTVAVNRGRDKEELARKLGASDYIDSAAEDPAKALTAMGGAKAILATVTNGEAMQAIAGGLGANGVLMVIGAVGPLTVNSFELIENRASVKGWYSGIARDSEDTLALQPAQQCRLDERGLPARQGPGSLRPHDERQGALPRRAEDGRLTRREASLTRETPAPPHRAARLSGSAARRRGCARD